MAPQIFLALALSASPVCANDTETRVHDLASQLRCVVCQNQSLADSSVELAQRLKQEIRTQVQQGASDTAIRAFMVQRYGEFVLYQPPWDARTWLLWTAPLWLLAGGGGLLWRHLKRLAWRSKETSL